MYTHILDTGAKRVAKEEASKLDDSKSDECTTKCGTGPATAKEE